MFIKAKLLWSNYKRELIVGIVVSLATALIMQTANWFVATAPAMGNSVWATIKNLIYSSAATQSNLSVLSIVLTYALAYIISSCYLIPTTSLISIYKEKKTLEKLEDLLVTMNPNSEKSEDLKEKAHLEFSKLLKENLSKKQSHKNSDSKTIKKVFVLATFLIVLLTLYGILFLLLPLNFVDRFQLAINAVTPYCDTYTIQKLESDWVCMRSEEEYQEIYKVIDEIKQEHQLP